jgi:pyridoxine/pyridoxamine 5'-phosphate oxidase
MTREDQIKKIYNFIHKAQVCVLSTVNIQGNPESAVMGHSEMEDLKVIFQTPNNTRKYNNLQKSTKVAIVFGWSLEDWITIQYEGDAKEVNAEEIEMCRQIHTAKDKIHEKYAYLPQNKYFIVSPKYIRYSDVKRNEKFELNF